MSEGDFTLGKHERLCSKKLLETLFGGGGSHALSAYPVRVVYTLVEREPQMPPAMLMVSVSKRYFKRAVKRNRLKRLMREGYRKHKQLVWEAMDVKPSQTLIMAFMWMDNVERDAATVEAKIVNLLERIAERLR